MDTEIIDQATATAALHKVRDDLANALVNVKSASDLLRRYVIEIRPTGLLSVEEMAEAVGRNRNYIDQTWSAYGNVVRGKQTRTTVADADHDAAVEAYGQLSGAARAQYKATGDLNVARAERDRVIVAVYASKILGPSAIAAAVNLDRNHILRTARKAGIAPAHRAVTRNQYTAAK